MAGEIKAVFERYAQGLKIDRSLIERIHRYERQFVNRNEEHIEFFGSNLLGVHRVRFRTTDWEVWFDDVLGIDDVTLKQDLHSLDVINPSFRVSSDVMNISCMWVVHAIANSNLSNKLKHQGMIDTLLIFHYKVLSSKLAHDFRYPANREAAAAAYSVLSKKFSLKRYGSWAAMLRARCEDIISRRSIHYKTIDTFQDDEGILYMVTDTQGRIRDVVKKMYEVFQQVREGDARIVTRSSTIDIDGVQEVRDVSRLASQYRHYLKTIILDKRSLIKRELVDIIGSAMHTMSPNFLVESLVFSSEHFQQNGYEYIEEFIDELMAHLFEFLSRRRENVSRRNDLPFMLTSLRGIYMSSRSSDPSLMKLRKLGDRIVDKSVRSRSQSAKASVRTGLMLYIVLRTLTRNHYT